jgi:V8-like Glu-specific endopeptidase
MSCHHVFSKAFLNSKDDIKLVINDEIKTISLKGRKIWINEKMDYACIEIKEKEDNIHTFYNLDDNVYDDKYSNDNYLNQNVLIFAINKNDKQIGFSNGLILKNKETFFEYNCNTYPGCSGGCIVNQLDNHVIGIHEGEIELGNKNKINQGIYIKNVIKNIKETTKGNFVSNVK